MTVVGQVPVTSSPTAFGRRSAEGDSG